MTEINHQQARRLIQAVLHTRLPESEQVELAEHLQACKACRAYAREMEALETRLRGNFQARWGTVPSPSTRIDGAVQTKMRAKRMIKTMYSFASLVALAVALVALMVFAISLLPGQSLPLAGESVTPAQLEGSEPTPQLSNTPLLIEAEPTPAPAGSPGQEETIVEPELHNTNTSMTPAPEHIYPGLIAFFSLEAGNGDIFVMHPDGSEKRNLTNHPAFDYHPVWSPAGNRLAFLSGRAGSQVSEVYVIDAGGSDLAQLTSPVFPEKRMENLSGVEDPHGPIFPQYGSLSWSPDGQRLAAALMADSANFYLALIDAKGGGDNVYVKVDLIDLSSIRWSPDGRWVAFASGYDIQILDASLPQGEQTAPVNLTKTDGWRDGFNLDWSPDSSRLAYFSHVGVTDLERPEGRSIPRGKASWELRVAEINGTGYTLLEMGASLPSFGPTGLAWAPGGERLAFTMPYDPDGLPRPLLYVINADGSGLAPLIEQPFASNDLSWSPDGDWLLFSSPGTGIWTLEVEAALRGAPALYQLTAAGDSVPAWQPSLGP